MIHHYKRILLLFIILFGIIFETPVFADGSKDLYPAGVGGKRAYLASSGGGLTTNSWPFQSRGTMKVFVKNNEYIYVGSSAQGIAAGSINIFAPNVTPNASRSNFTFSSGSSTTIGRIANRTQELNGPSPTAAGYTPYVVQNTTGADGIFEIDFIPPSTPPGPGAIPSPGDIAGDVSWTATNTNQQPNNQPLILAWDVSVRDRDLTETDLVAYPFITGRAYTNVFNGHITSDFSSSTGGFYGKFFVLTKDGFAYRVSGNGQVGAGFTFFVNNRGYTTGINGQGTSTYKSLNYSAGPRIKNPTEADDINITHKIFFTKPANDLPASAAYNGTTTWLREPSPQIPSVTSVAFVGVEGSASNVSSKGAYIKFNSNFAGTFKITIPGNGDFNDRVLTGTSAAGANQILWDGKAGLSAADPVSPGAPTPPGTVLSTIKVQLFGAEVHFPFIDVEINPKGIIIEQLTTDGNYNTIAGKDVVYWDDSDVPTGAGTTASFPRKAAFGVNGQSSNANGHKFGKNDNGGAGATEWGNERAIDTYSFVEGNEVTLNFSATIQQADLEVTSITPSVTTQQVGNTITYTVVVKNLSTPGVSISDVTGATFGFEYPTGFTVNSAVLTVNNGTIVESSPTTTATKFSSTLSMTTGSEATYVITGTVGAALKNTTFTPRATILRPADITDPNATDESTPTFSGSVDTECNGAPSGAGCNNILSPTGVTIPNTPPVANPNTNSTNMNITLTVADGATGVGGDLLMNDTDADGDALVVTKFTVAGSAGDQTLGGAGFDIPGQGTITINADGSYSFVPVTNFTGAVNTITYTISDGTATTTTTLNITVNATNSAPTGVANTNTVAEDVTLAVADGATGLTGDLLVNDTDPENDVLTITKFTVNGIVGDQAVATPFLIPAVGTITINANGSYTFVPVANYNGTVPQITYTLYDGALTATTTLDITVTPVNDVPVLVANTNTVAEDATLTVIDGATGVTGDLLVNDSDADGETLTVASYSIAGIVGTQTVSTPVVITGVGTITINANGSYTFVPALNYNGTVPQITYTATDGTASATSTLDITVTPVQDAPVLTANTNTVAEDATLTVVDGTPGVTGDILVNDADADGEILTVASYTIAGIVGTQTVSTPVVITGVGTITINANGSYTFVPALNYNGTVPQITYTATDGTASATSTLDITVTPVQDAPVLTANTNTVAEDATLTVVDGAPGVTGDILVNDADADGETLTVASYTIAGIVGTQTVSTPVVITGVGTITINANGSYTFVPALNYNGTVPQITYTATDGTASATSTLDITVTPVQDAPVLTANTNTVAEDATLTVVDGAQGVTGDILVNDADADGETLTVASYTIAGIVGTQTVSTPVVITGVGTITINANGSYTFVPALNYNGAVPQITYTATDGIATATSTLDITVTPVNDSPIAVANTNTTLEDTNLTVADGTTGVTGDILVNDSDPENDVLTVAGYTIAGMAGNQAVGTPVVINGVGTILINADGSYAFQPALNFNGSVPVINYTVSDGNTGTVTSTLTIGVTPVNDIPAFTKGADQTAAIGAATQTVNAWATAISKGPANENAQIVDFVVTNDKNTLFATQPAISPTGVLTYTPAPGQYGKATVTVYIHDDGGTANGGVDQSATQTFVISIKPVGTPDTDITPINTSTTTVVTANDGASGVGTSVILGGTNPANGSITINPDKSITYTPNNGYVGTDTYTYILETPDGVKSDPVTVTITVYDPKITLAKEGTYNDFNANGKVDAGDRIHYTFVVTNTGTVPVTNITITDANATIVGGPIASLAVAGVDNSTFTGFQTLTQAEIDNGGVFNLATATGKDPKNNNVTTTSNDPTPLDPTDPNYPVTPPTPACPSCTVTPIVQTGSMTLAKEGVYNDTNADGTVNVGDRINYTFVVTNTGNTTLTNVMVTDPGATISGGPIASLVVGAADNATFTGYHVLTQADIDNSGVYNLATAKAKDPKGKDITTISNDPTPLDPTDPNYPVTPPTPACPSCTVTPVVQTGSMTLAKEGVYNDTNADGKVNVGDRINYTFVVTNTGNTTLTNVTVTDPGATISGGPIASLAVGAADNTTFTGYHVLTQADIDNSGVYNLATAQAKDPKGKDITTISNDPTPLDPTDPNYPVTPPTPACPSCTVTPIVQTGSMTLAKEGVYNDANADGKVNVGDRINYTFVVTNTGNTTLTNVMVTDPGATISGGPIASLAVGAADNTTFTGYHVLTQADIDNSGVYNLATAKAKDPKGKDITTISNDPTPLDPTDPNYPVTPPTPACPSCTVTPIVQTGSMTLAKEGVYNDANADGKVNVGDRINYTFVVTNTGNTTLTNVTVTDPGATISGGPIASLAVGASDNATFTGYHVLTQADIDNSGVFNTATVKAKDPKGKDITTTSNDPTPLDPTDPNYPVTTPTPACPTCTVTPIPQNGSMSVAKDGVYNDANNDGKVNVGDRINYTFTVTNTGNVTLTNIMVTDANAVVNGGPITTLAVGASNSTMFTAYHILTQADIDNGGVFNSAIAKGKDPKNKEITTISNDPTPLDPTDPNHPVTPPTPACPTCTVTPIVQTGSMTLLKDGIYNDANNDGKVNVGDRINYTFTVSNTGNVTLTNITVADANAVIVGGPLASLAPGAVNNATFTGYHVLTQTDIDNRGVFNTATATGKDSRDRTVTVNSTDPTPIAPGAPNYPLNPPTPACPTCTVTPIVHNGSVALVKTVTNAGNGAGGTFVLGDAIQYTFTVTNTGNVTLSNITLTDAKLGAGTITVPGTLAPNAVATLVRTYTVTTSDIAAGNVTNTAVVDAKDPANNPVTDVSGSTPTNNTPTVTTLAKPPVANNDAATTRQNDPVVVTVVTNDNSGSTPIVPATVLITVQPTHGTVNVNADGTVIYTPNPGYVGVDAFTYTVKDANGQTSNPAVVNLTIVPSDPKATNDAAKTTFSSPVTIPVLSNDVKDGADFDPASIEIVGQPQHGIIKFNADGTITYTPNDGYTGTETFTYRAKDKYGNWTNMATVTVVVEGTFIPNVITPDGDGKNDFFVIVGLPNYDRVEVEIYNRWGNQVYINKNYNNDWNGERLNEGTYYYNIRFKKGSIVTAQKGWILIKR